MIGHWLLHHWYVLIILWLLIAFIFIWAWKRFMDRINPPELWQGCGTPFAIGSSAWQVYDKDSPGYMETATQDWFTGNRWTKLANASEFVCGQKGLISWLICAKCAMDFRLPVCTCVPQVQWNPKCPYHLTKPWWDRVV